MFRKKSRKLGINRYDTLIGYMFILPLLVLTLIFTVYPIFISLILSFFKIDFFIGFSSIKFYGLDIFKSTFKDVWFLASLKNTLIYSLGTVPIGISLALIIAVIINKFVYVTNFFKIGIFMPYISSIVASAVLWIVVFHPIYGPINRFLMSIGISEPPRWFGDMKWALPTVIAFSIWQQIGYLIIVYVAGLKGIPQELYEAAKVDGAGPIRQFFSITIPMISPTTFFLVIMQMINSFKVFDQIKVLTSGGPGTATTVVSYYIYRAAFEYYEISKASAAAWITFVIVFAITLVQWKYQKKWTAHL